MNNDEGVARVRRAVAECLDREIDDVNEASRLIDDLGADSLDIIDLVFTLEKAFAVSLRGNALDLLARLNGNDAELVQEGVLTAAARARLGTFVPELPGMAGVTPRALYSMITVGSLWRIVALELERRSPEVHHA